MVNWNFILKHFLFFILCRSNVHLIRMSYCFVWFQIYCIFSSNVIFICFFLVIFSLTSRNDWCIYQIDRWIFCFFFFFIYVTYFVLSSVYICHVCPIDELRWTFCELSMLWIFCSSINYYSIKGNEKKRREWKWKSVFVHVDR